MGGFEIFLERELTGISDGFDMRSERNGRIQGVREIPRILKHLQFYKSLFRRVVWLSLQEVGAPELFQAPSLLWVAPPALRAQPLQPCPLSVNRPFVKVGEAVSMVTGFHPRWGRCRPCAQHQPERLLGYHSDRSTGNKRSIKLLRAAAEAACPQTRKPQACPV